jgi:ABC-type amino acid transport substrate-binding protein
MKASRLLCFLSPLLLLGCAKRDVLVIGTDATYPPFEFVDEKGKISGVSVAIGEEIAKKLGKPETSTSTASSPRYKPVRSTSSSPPSPPMSSAGSPSTSPSLT